MSIRAQVIKTIKETLSSMRGGRYKVIRGAVPWARFDFEVSPHAIAIIVDQGSLLKDINDATISLEFASVIDAKEIEDGLMDEFFEDASELLNRLTQTKLGNDNLIFKLDRTNIRVVEFSDSTLMVQGIIVTFTIDY